MVMARGTVDPDDRGNDREPMSAQYRVASTSTWRSRRATNTLPIRRHDMALGAKIQVAAAWVQFPSLELAVLDQRYQRIDRYRYRYESPAHQFSAMIDVDDLGLVRTYEGLWERITESALR